MKALRRAGLIESGRKSVRVPNLERLREFSGFTPDYLLLPGPNPAVEALGALPQMTGQVRAASSS